MQEFVQQAQVVHLFLSSVDESAISCYLSLTGHVWHQSQVHHRCIYLKAVTSGNTHESKNSSHLAGVSGVEKKNNFSIGPLNGEQMATAKLYFPMSFKEGNIGNGRQRTWAGSARCRGTWRWSWGTGRSGDWMPCYKHSFSKWLLPILGELVWFDFLVKKLSISSTRCGPLNMKPPIFRRKLNWKGNTSQSILVRGSGRTVRTRKTFWSCHHKLCDMWRVHLDSCEF